MKKTVSARRRLMRYFILMAVFALILMAGYGFYSMWTYESQMKYCCSAATDIVTNALQSDADTLLEFDQNIYASNEEFRLLSSRQARKADQVVRLYNLNNMTDSRVPAEGIILLFNRDGTVFRAIYGMNLMSGGGLPAEIIEAAHLLRDWCLNESDSSLAVWNTVPCKTFTFLVNTYHYKDFYICSAIELNAFAQSRTQNLTGEISVVLCSSADYLNRASIADPDSLPAPQRLSDSDGSAFVSSGSVYACKSLPGLNLSVSCMMPVRGIWQFSRVSMILVIVLCALLIVGFVLIYHIINRMMIYPLQQISSASAQLSGNQGGLSASPEAPETVAELETIRTALNSLVEQKVTIQKENDAFEAEKEHALLQYYQLQTRSHFFLNCLKSLYGMLETQDYDRMRQMIIAFSNHLRFIFHDNLALVPLHAEMNEVEDYHRIISMDSRQPIFLIREIADDAQNCMVPPLVIQTFLENSYKYNGRGKIPLHFRIHIDIVTYQDSPHLRIRLTDDGIGYTEEKLADLNRMPENRFEQYNIGINNLRRRMALLYKDDFEVAFFNARSGGACSLICIPVRAENS